jgi:hypothetical protein
MAGVRWGSCSAGVVGIPQVLHELLQGAETEGDFLEERGVVGDETEIRMPGPERAQFDVEGHGFLKGLGAHGIAAFDGSAADGRGLKEYDRVIACEFGFDGGMHGFEILGFRTWPISGAVDGAAVAEQNPAGVEGAVFFFEMPLDVIDGGLGVAFGGGLGGAWKAALEEDGGRLGYDDNRMADFTAEEVSGSGFATTGAAGEGDTEGAAWLRKWGRGQRS